MTQTAKWTIACLVIALSSCITYINTISNKDLGDQYNPSVTAIHPAYNVYHTSDSISEIEIRFYQKELHFITIGKQKLAKFAFKYTLYKSYENNELIDSGTVKRDIPYLGEKDYAYTKIQVATNAEQSALLTLETIDELRTYTTTTYLNIRHDSVENGQYFKAISAYDSSTVFGRTVGENEYVKVVSQVIDLDKLFLSYRSRELPLSPPPFSAYTPQPLELDKGRSQTLQYSDSLSFSFKRKGIYHIETDTSTAGGLTLYNFGAFYPELKIPVDMLRPLQYLTSGSEFVTLTNARDKKEALDSFWLNCSGDIHRAKELIRIFYNRALFANMYFSSVTEGWRTDRGMLFLIFGPPQHVYRHNNGERWVYAENVENRTFEFAKAVSPYTDNDYLLDRKLEFKDLWHRAVESWRSGRAFYLAN